MKRLSIAPRARDDLRTVAKRISEDNPRRARSYVAELKAQAARAAERPLAFRVRPDIAPDVRSIVHGRYLILFRELPEQVVILRFWHTAQNPGDLNLD